MPHSPAIASALAAFLASLVEFVEALTIVLAVSLTRGWRPAAVGTIAATVLLALLVAIFGPALQAVPIERLQFVIGVLLLLFGLRWLRKAVLRSLGVIALHDEEQIFNREAAALATQDLVHAPRRRFNDPIGTVTAFKAVFLEGLEVVFIVIATGAGAAQLLPATLGATLAGVVVIAAGFVLHRPLARVPENTLKYVVGTLLSAFGTFWVGEALHYPWPGEDLALVGLALLFFAFAQGATWIVRRA